MNAQIEKVKAQSQKVKAHFRKNKAAYIIGSTAVAATAGVTFLVTRQVNVNQTARVIQGLAYKSPVTTHQFHITLLEQRGHPGFQILDLATGERYGSIRRASIATGVPRRHIQDFFAGLRDHIDGHEFVNAGKMPVEGVPLAG